MKQKPKRLKVNQQILSDLEAARDALSFKSVSQELVPHCEALQLYLDTWVRSKLERAIWEMRNE